MKKRKKIWLAGVLATLTIIGTAPASLATETESTEAADKAETTAETEQEPAASENSSEASTEEVESTTGEKVIFVLIMVLMFVAPVLLFFILLVIFTKLQNFIMKKTGRVPGANMGKHRKSPEELKKNSRKK